MAIARYHFTPPRLAKIKKADQNQMLSKMQRELLQPLAGVSSAKTTSENNLV